MDWKNRFSLVLEIEVGRMPQRATVLERLARLEKAQHLIICLLAALVGFGIVMIYSSSAVRSLQVLDPTRLLRKQLLWASLGTVVLILFWNTDYRLFLKHHQKIFIGILILLVAVLIPGIGVKVNGARRWIRIAGIGIQPSEIAKIVSILYVSSYLVLQKDKLSSFKKGFLPVMIPLGLLVGFIMIEPDFGTSMFILIVCSALLIVGGTPLKHFLPFGLAGLPVVCLMMLLKFDHIKSRLLVFLYPELDPLGKGHQIRQSLIALGSGGWNGLGLGASRQKLFFLPEDHTDFILAIIGEELGLWGTLLVVALFLSLLFYGRRIMNSASDLFGHYLAFGILFAFSLQGVMNIAVVTASMPTKGISLPMISFGGSSMVCSMATMGILLNIGKTRRNQLCLELQKISSPA